MTTSALTLSNPGLRTDRMNEDRAHALVEQWQVQLLAASDGHISTMDLHGRVYDPEAVPILVNFLIDKLDRCTVVLMSDIIASLPTEKGLSVLSGFAALFLHAPIVELDVSDNAIGQQGLALEPFQNLLKCKTLERLTMENDGLDEDCMTQLASILLQEDDDHTCVCDHLTLLHFYNNMSGIGGAHATGQILARCRNLQSFRYEGCRPQPMGCQSLANGLLECSKHSDALMTIRLEGSYGKDIDLDAIGALTRALNRSTQLSNVILYDTALEDKGTKQLCKALKGHTLEALELPQNEITHATVKNAINNLVKNNMSTLRILNLSSNELTSVGVEYLMEVFEEGESVLEILKLSENMIGTRGAVALISNADKLTKLKELHLDDNGFPDEVVAQLVETFGNKLIDMENNIDEDMDEDLEEDDDDEEDEDYEDDEDDLEDFTQQFESQAHM